ncbi:MAG TPA: ATP-binding protein [Burkholderiaceae bacterium]
MNKQRPDADVSGSWFGPGLGDTDAVPLDAVAAAPAARTVPPPAGFFTQQPPWRASAGGGSFQRLYRAFLGARAGLGLALLATLLLARLLGSSEPRWALLICAVYAGEAALMWLLPRLQRGVSMQSMARLNSPQWLASIGFDLALFGGLHALDPRAGVSFSALFVLPVLMAGVLTPRLLALGTAAIAALLLLGTATWGALFGNETELHVAQAGIAGIGLFVVVLLASEVASRLAREERAARGSMEYARQQSQLSRLVIDEMQEGVLVVDRRGRVRAANPAAHALLGEQEATQSTPFQLRGVPAWTPLVKGVEQAFAEGQWPIDGRDVSLEFTPSLRRSLRVRMRFTRSREQRAGGRSQGNQGGEELCVLFLEDLRSVIARSRQEKLAAMGRISAGIAHEIRNPLAAIAQANALMAEDCGDDLQQQRLTAMVTANVERLKRLVDDVMEVAPGTQPSPVALDVRVLMNEIVSDWARTNDVSVGADAILFLQLPPPDLRVAFEAEHLRRVLINLLDNALRHSPQRPGAIRVSAALHGGETVALAVFSQGQALEPEVERHLFEPFFSTRSRGSGLGLYICRELCERYGARIDYLRREGADPGNEFVVLLLRAHE